MFEIRSEQWGFWIAEKDEILAAVVSGEFKPESLAFITPENFGLQLALMKRDQGHEILSHTHYPVNRDLVGTQEVLLIRSGKLRADIYGVGKNYLCSVNLFPGDLILLHKGGHGFFASEDCFFVEVKQGPYTAGRDKEVFPAHSGSLNILDR